MLALLPSAAPPSVLPSRVSSRSTKGVHSNVAHLPGPSKSSFIADAAWCVPSTLRRIFQQLYVPPLISPVLPHSLLPSPSLSLPSSTTFLTAAPASCRSASADAFSPCDRLYLDGLISAQYAYLSEAYDTQQDGEVSVEEALASSVGLFAYVAPALLPSSALLPIPSTKCHEVPLRQALRVNGSDRLTSATAIELDKQFRLNALGDVCPLDMLPANAIVFDAHVYKLKADGRETCRIAVMGNRIPPAMDEQTFASVISDGAKIFLIAAMQAHCEASHEAMIISDCDVVGGFLHIPLNSPVPMFLRLPPNLPHPLAGKLVRILGAVYGLRESNRLFGLEMSRVIVEDAGFACTAAERRCFVRIRPDDLGKKCIASVTVDDVLVVSNDQDLVDILFAALAARFGPLTQHAVSSLHTGLEITRHTNGAVSLT